MQLEFHDVPPHKLVFIFSFNYMQIAKADVKMLTEIFPDTAVSHIRHMRINACWAVLRQSGGISSGKTAICSEINNTVITGESCYSSDRLQ